MPGAPLASSKRDLARDGPGGYVLGRWAARSTFEDAKRERKGGRAEPK